MATIVLRLAKGTPLTNVEVDGNFSNINSELSVVSGNVANINSELSVVSGNVANINSELSVVSGNVGAVAQLTTTANTNVVASINEVLTRATSNVAITGGNISGVTSISTTGNVGGASALFSYTVTALDFNSTSDITLKDNILPISNPLEIINKLAGIEFTWKGTNEKSFGLAAQSVEDILPDVVKTRPDGYKGINYNNLIAFLIEAIKDLSGQVQSLKNLNSEKHK